MLRGAAVVMFLLAGVLAPSCQCDAKAAACDQALIALCELDSACGDGLDIGACVASHPDFTCSVGVSSSQTCVEAINDVLRDDCAGADDVNLPCPLLTQAGLYQPCTETLICAAGAPCASGVDPDGDICSAVCDAATPCPNGGGCSVDGFCSPICTFDFICADVDICVDGGCVACSDLCGDGCGAVVEGCECPICPECTVDDDCAFGSCVEGVCG